MRYSNKHIELAKLIDHTKNTDFLAKQHKCTFEDIQIARKVRLKLKRENNLGVIKKDASASEAAPTKNEKKKETMSTPEFEAPGTVNAVMLIMQERMNEYKTQLSESRTAIRELEAQNKELEKTNNKLELDLRTIEKSKDLEIKEANQNAKSGLEGGFEAFKMILSDEAAVNGLGTLFGSIKSGGNSLGSAQSEFQNEFVKLYKQLPTEHKDEFSKIAIQLIQHQEFGESVLQIYKQIFSNK